VDRAPGSWFPGRPADLPRGPLQGSIWGRSTEYRVSRQQERNKKSVGISCVHLPTHFSLAPGRIASQQSKKAAALPYCPLPTAAPALRLAGGRGRQWRWGRGRGAGGGGGGRGRGRWRRGVECLSRARGIFASAEERGADFGVRVRGCGRGRGFLALAVAEAFWRLARIRCPVGSSSLKTRIP
jgi:hypothetical protein